MRAGTYATFDGRTFHASVRPTSTNAVLVNYGADGSLPGFVRDEGEGGRWIRVAALAECERLFRVATSAWYRELFPVQVRSVREDVGVAVVNYYPDEVIGPSPRDADGRFVEPPLPADHGAGWTGAVPLKDLTGAVEVEEELSMSSEGNRHTPMPYPRLVHPGRR